MFMLLNSLTLPAFWWTRLLSHLTQYYSSEHPIVPFSYIISAAENSLLKMNLWLLSDQAEMDSIGSAQLF